MSMRQDMQAMSRFKVPTLAFFVAVCMGLLLFWGLQAYAQTNDETSEFLEIELLQRDIQHISGQIRQLRQLSQQTDKNQQELGRALREKIDGLESRQQQLTQDLAVLKASSQLQIEDLQATQQRLQSALKVTAAFLCISLGGLIWLWRSRRVTPVKTPNGPLTTLPARIPTSNTAPPKEQAVPVEKVTTPTPIEPSPRPETVEAATFETTPVEPVPVAIDTFEFPEISPPFSAAPWAEQAAADLQKTQLAMKQADQDFMRSVRIQP